MRHIAGAGARFNSYNFDNTTEDRVNPSGASATTGASGDLELP